MMARLGSVSLALIACIALARLADAAHAQPPRAKRVMAPARPAKPSAQPREGAGKRMQQVAGARATDVAHPPRLLDAHGQPVVVYHGSDVADERVLLRANDKGLLHVSTRASFSRQYGATLQAFHIVAPKLFVWALHGHLLPQALGRDLVVDDELGVNSHGDTALHATLRRLGFMGYRYQQYDFERDRAVTNYALFGATHLVKAPSP